MCTPLQECLNGTTCVPRYTQVQWVYPPTVNPFYDYDYGAFLMASLDLAPGRTRNDPSTLSFEVVGDGGRITGTLNRVDAGLYQRTQVVPIGDWQATVYVPDAGLIDGPRPFKMLGLFRVAAGTPAVRSPLPDLLPDDPGFDGGPVFRRDEQTTMMVTNPGPASAVTLSAMGVLRDGGTDRLILNPTACNRSCPDAGYCSCFALDLARPTFEAFRGTMGFEVIGNTTGILILQNTEVDGLRLPGVRVTRWKWAWLPPTAVDAGVNGAYSVQAPALDSAGNLYLGFFHTNGMGLNEFGFRSLSPSGAVRWATSSSSPLSAQMMVAPGRDGGSEQVLVGAQPEGFLSLAPATGTPTPLCTLPANHLIYGYLALVDAPGVAPFVPPSLVPVSIGSDVTVPSSTRTLFTGFSAPPLFTACPTNALSVGQPEYFPLAASGDLVAVGDVGANLWQTYTGNISPSTAYSPPMAHPITFATQVLVRGGNLFGTSANGFFGLPMPQVELSSGAANGSLVVRGSSFGATFIYPSTSAGLPVLVSVANVFGTPTVSQTSLPFPGPVTLAVGRNDALYAASQTGRVAAWSQGRLQWVSPADMPSGDYRTGRSLLDCTRNAMGTPVPGRPGVMYVAGAPLRVLAIITDSPGLDTASEWPVPFHDPRGTNNFQMPMNEFTCP
jgi:hypothetical protein